MTNQQLLKEIKLIIAEVMMQSRKSGSTGRPRVAMTHQDAMKQAQMLLAYSKGATIQFQDSGSWNDLKGRPKFRYGMDHYRVKPTPRTFDMMVKGKKIRVMEIVED